MYDYKMIKNTSRKYFYTYQGRNELNQILNLDIFWCEGNYFHVLFFITTKRRSGFQYLKQTGRDGIKSLLWAKSCIADFINKFKEKYRYLTIRIYADDKRRMKTYERGLIPIGFKKAYGQREFLF